MCWTNQFCLRARRCTTAGALILGLLLPALLAGCGQQAVSVPRGGTVLCFGDSITRGTGASPGKSYPDLLQDLTGLNVINAGIPGELSSAGRNRLPSLLERYHPDLVIICHGGNDLLQNRAASEIEQDVAAMIGAAREAGCSVILIGVPRPGIVLRAAPFYRKLARRYGIVYEEKILSRILSDRSLKSDHIHPNDQGYRLLAERLAQLIRLS